jgi:hypothetical protein
MTYYTRQAALLNKARREDRRKQLIKETKERKKEQELQARIDQINTTFLKPNLREEISTRKVWHYQQLCTFARRKLGKARHLPRRRLPSRFGPLRSNSTLSLDEIARQIHVFVKNAPKRSTGRKRAPGDSSPKVSPPEIMILLSQLEVRAMGTRTHVFKHMRRYIHDIRKETKSAKKSSASGLGSSTTLQDTEMRHGKKFNDKGKGLKLSVHVARLRLKEIRAVRRFTETEWVRCIQEDQRMRDRKFLIKLARRAMS